jgi:hypothetical protein
MVLPRCAKEFALQSESEIRELRCIFDLHSAPYGAPEHLKRFIRRLREDSDFALNLSSLTHSIRLKEKGYLLEEELLFLVLIAVVGHDLSTLSVKFAEHLAELGELLREKTVMCPHSSTTQLNIGEEACPKGVSLNRVAGTFIPSRAQANQSRAMVFVVLTLTLMSVGGVIAERQRAQAAKLSQSALTADRNAEGSSLISAAENKSSPVGRSPESMRERLTRTAGRYSETKHGGASLAPIPLSWRSQSHPPQSFSAGGTHHIGLSSGVMSANLLESDPPSYPRLARLTHVQGPVIIEAIVSGRGTVEAVHVVKGPFLLRRAASKAVRTWRYRPFIFRGKPAEISTIVKVDFML